MNVMSEEDERKVVEILKRHGYTDAAERIAWAKAQLSAALAAGALSLTTVDGELGARVEDIKKLWPE